MKLFLSLFCVGLLLSTPALARKGADDVSEGGHRSAGHDQYDDQGGDRDRSFSASPSDDDGHDHGSMDHSGAVDYYAPAMETMHADMMIEPTGNADVDFVRGMIPHHQGAIDMAKILKEKGKDPELQSLAGGIIAAQEKEIAFMKDWLARHGQ